MTSADTAARVHQLDALRAGALLLGVLGHATISFFPDPEWVADDLDSSPVLLVANFVAHIFRMSLFFVIAGFFAHLLLQKRGAHAFIRNRLKRIALPFLVFWPILTACLVLIAFWDAGWTNPFAAQGSGSAPAPSGAPPAMPALWQVLPLGHTWFLYVVVWFYAAALVLVGLARALDSKGRVAAALDAIVRTLGVTHVLPVALAMPLTAVFLLQHWTGAGGIRTPDFGLVPNASAVVGFGTAFAFGWFLHRQPTLLNVWQRWWLLYWVATLALTVYCARVMAAITGGDAVALPAETGERLLAAAAYPLAIWAWCFALLGTATRFLSAENRVVRYLSDSSYWIYLVHLPVVVALQVWVSQWLLGWQVKYPLILAIAIPILLASYQLLVRNSFLGAWLNGRRHGGAATARTSDVRVL